MANFLHTFNHDGICGPRLLRVGMLAHPFSSTPSTRVTSPPSTPSQVRLATYSYVYSNQPPLSPLSGLIILLSCVMFVSLHTLLFGNTAYSYTYFRNVLYNGLYGYMVPYSIVSIRDLKLTFFLFLVRGLYFSPSCFPTLTEILKCKCFV